MTDVSKKETMTLNISKVSIRFGGLTAVSDFNLSLKKNELCGLIGPNGAGKTTVFNLITGVYKPNEGSLFLENTNLSPLRPFEIAKTGISRTFQNIRLFPNLTVEDNVLISNHMSSPYSYKDLLLSNTKFNMKERLLKEEAIEILSLFQIEKKVSQFASDLSYGDQRRLEIARALATKPKLLLLDEPAAGMNSKEKQDLMNVISKVRNHFQCSILLIEHDMKLVMGICERILVLDHGETIAEGTPHKIQKDEKVIKAYLGVA